MQERAGKFHISGIRTRLQEIFTVKSEYKQVIRRNTSERGQTLIVGVLAIIVLFIAVLFIFDLQSIIRVKVKTQTAADAAALAGARMQVESLNLIGEINLIKACTVLVTDYAGGIDTPEALAAASANLTEMQARVSFVGPLLGVGAAQQAAKNNGMIEYASLANDMNDYLNDVRDDDIYGNDAVFRQNIEGYHWRDGYIEMLELITRSQMAAAPHVNVASFNDEFADPSLFSAINSDFWCHDTLRQLIKDDSNFLGRWWQGLAESVRFIEESELIPLYVRYRRGTTPFEEALPYLTTLADERDLTVSDLYDKDEREDEDGINTPIPYMRWCTYDFRWDYNAPGNHWTDGSKQLYLRRGIRDEYTYGGAFSFFRCEVDEASWLSGSYSVHRISRKKGVISASETTSPEVEATAAAKPLGYITADGTNYTPNSIDMILPVFHSAKLIPTAMPPADNATTPGSEQWLIYKFLLWCDTVGDIDNPGSAPPPGTEDMLKAFQKLNDPLWRHSGWNPSYNYTPPGEVVLYDPATDTGAGFLQEPAGNPDDPESDGYMYDDDGNIIGISYTQDDLCDWGPHGGIGGGGGGGPGSLH